MLINGKADSITVNDLLKVAKFAGIKTQDASQSIEQIREVITHWETFANDAGLSDTNYMRIQKHFT